MNFYDKKENIEKYCSFSDAYDGAELIGVLERFLPRGSTLLELGMGPGKDFGLLKTIYNVTGSDNSAQFIDLNREQYKEADLLLLDARSLETDRTFDGIFSNKVLVHLTRQELCDSLARQHELLNDNGLILHSFWYGNKEEVYDGLRLAFYTESQLRTLFEECFEIIEIERHQKVAENDSLYVLARKK
jgi:cyclopropane fatty-acyl-phospholipid synthase-like methyltransferase